MVTEFTKEWIKEARQTSYLSRPILTNSRLDEIERLQQRIAELEQERRWIRTSNTDELPARGQEVIVVRKDGTITSFVFFKELIDMFRNRFDYWCYLLEPPQEEE